jgi:3-ketosteroid 9alpha-monooxygenase subunit B
VSNISSIPIVSDDPRHRFHDITVKEVIRETADATSFVFEIPAALESLFAYKPGQFFTFEIPWQDFAIKRCYSLSSTGSWNEAPKVTVKRVDDGRVSNWMNENLAPNNTIRIMPPAGAFVLHEQANIARPLTLFGGGSGITPVISLLKQALLETTRPVKMIYANRDRASVIFYDELTAIQAKYGDRFELVHHLDDAAGFLNDEGVAGHIAGRSDSDFYICGPTPFMDTVERVLEAAEIVGEIHIERFVSAVDPDRAPEATDEAPVVTDGLPGRVKILVNGKTHEVEYQAGETLLSAAIRAGLDIPFSCQDGYCSCCMAKLRAGKVTMASREALTDREIAEGWVLTCQAKPTTSACEVEYED